jgi:peptidyl-prolyl cis-trans isomerase B (cyclophilin B)
MQRKIIIIIASALIVVTLLSPKLPFFKEQEQDIITTECGTKIDTSVYKNENADPVAVFQFSNCQDVIVVLSPKSAPKTVANFIDLANSERYDKNNVHRVIPNEILQAGKITPESPNIEGEFNLNSVNNTIVHEPGVISMARVNGEYNSASSQFFFVLNKRIEYDGQYAAFGKTVKGLEFLQQYSKVKLEGSVPVTPITFDRIRVNTFGKEYPVERL